MNIRTRSFCDQPGRIYMSYSAVSQVVHKIMTIVADNE